MKKILGLIILLLLLTGCGKKGHLTLDSIQNVKSKEELAELLNCDPLDLDIIATVITELNKTTEETSNDYIQENERMFNRDGEIAISIGSDNHKYANYYYTSKQSGATLTEHIYLDYYEFDRLFGIDN